MNKRYLGLTVIRHIVQTAKKRDSRAADVPTLQEVFDQHKVPANSRRFAQVVLAVGDFGRPIMLTPGTPPERVKILRDAVVKTLNDPDVRAEAKRVGWILMPLREKSSNRWPKIFSIPGRTFSNG